MAAIPQVAIETATGTTGSDGVAIFTFSADIDTRNHLIAVDRLPQGDTIDYTVSGTRQITFIAPSIPLAGARIWLWNGVVGHTVTTGLPAWDTVAELISDAAIELGLRSIAIADPFVDPDPNILQLLAYLKSGGRKLAKERRWSYLTSEYTFSTAAGTGDYPLPSDFRGWIDDSGWNRTTQMPLGGPLSSTDWQFTQAVTIAGALYTLVRFQGTLIRITPTPTSVATVAFEYLSTNWILPAGQSAPTSDLPGAATDTVCFDPALVVAMLKLEFKKNKGFDVTAEQQDFVRIKAQVSSEDSFARTIYFGSNGYGLRLLDELNVPQTGLGH